MDSIFIYLFLIHSEPLNLNVPQLLGLILEYTKPINWYSNCVQFATGKMNLGLEKWHNRSKALSENQGWIPIW